MLDTDPGTDISQSNVSFTELFYLLFSVLQGNSVPHFHFQPVPVSLVQRFTN